MVCTVIERKEVRLFIVLPPWLIASIINQPLPMFDNPIFGLHPLLFPTTRHYWCLIRLSSEHANLPKDYNKL